MTNTRASVTSPGEGLDLSPNEALEHLRAMLEIRHFEDECHRLFAQGLVRGSTHLCQGQEAVVVGACRALADGDTMTCTYRGHGAVLAMGAPLDRSFAEILGKAEGLCGGKGGSMHLTDVSVGALGSFAIVGAHLPITVGAAFAARYRSTGAVGLCFFGDGATNIGAFHEALNLASIWKLPAIFVIENNLYGEYSPLATTTPIERLADRADAYGMAKARIDGNDVAVVRATVQEAAARARAGEGPTLIEAMTYRQKGHSRSDPATYRPEGELEAWLERDPILLLERKLPADEVERVREGANQAVADALERAKTWPEPEPATRLEHVYVAERPTPGPPSSKPAVDASTLTYKQAITQAIADELDTDSDVFLLGEDVAAAGGAFKTTDGLYERFGKDRVLDTPISEQAIVGTAIGAAVMGLKPLAEIMFADFTGVCFDQIANELAKYRYMSGGQVACPVTIRMANGGSVGFGAQHSQSVENWFLNIPGLKIVVPGTPNDAYGLLRAAIQDLDPVLYFEHKGLFNAKGRLTGELVPLGRAEIARPGRDATIVASQLMRARALEVAERLAAEGIEMEVIDPRTLVPLDFETIAASVERTNRLIVVQECSYGGSWGATLAARIATERFDSLDAPPIVIGGDETPIPYAGPLEDAWIPSVDRIAAGVRGAL